MRKIFGDVVIVGHGKTPEGKGWGLNIDETAIVIRMWNWHWQSCADYGCRFDYGFYEISRTEMARFNKHVCTTPSIGWIGSRLAHKPYDGQLPQPTEEVDPTPLQELGMRMGGLGTKGRLYLTRGVCAAAWALSRMDKGGWLVLVGFDNVYDGVGLPMGEVAPQMFIDCPAGFPWRDYPEKTKDGPIRRYGNHDYGIEGPLLKELANRAGVKLVHAQDIWK